MSRRLEAEMSSQAARMVPEPWGEIPYFFAEHWGAFATAIAVCPPIPGSLHADFERRLELDGSYFVYRQLSPVEACDLTGWLDLLLQVEPMKFPPTVPSLCSLLASTSSSLEPLGSPCSGERVSEFSTMVSTSTGNVRIRYR